MYNDSYSTFYALVKNNTITKGHYILICILLVASVVGTAMFVQRTHTGQIFGPSEIDGDLHYLCRMRDQGMCHPRTDSSDQAAAEAAAQHCFDEAEANCDTSDFLSDPAPIFEKSCGTSPSSQMCVRWDWIIVFPLITYTCVDYVYTYDCPWSCNAVRRDCCGNHLLEAPEEECDLGSVGNGLYGEACRRDCTQKRCGDHITDSFNTPTIVDPRHEECDDGNTNSDDGCNACKMEYCGDGVKQVNLGEECDAGSANGTSAACDSFCAVPVCGDYAVYPPSGEECDDGSIGSLSCTSECKYNMSTPSIPSDPALSPDNSPFMDPMFEM